MTTPCGRRIGAPFLKYMVKSIGEKHGLRDTFMPKPFIDLAGSGCRAHVSPWPAKTKKNLFEDPDGELGRSRLACHFIGGVIHSAEAICAGFVSSYPEFGGTTGTPTRAIPPSGSAGPRLTADFGRLTARGS